MNQTKLPFYAHLSLALLAILLMLVLLKVGGVVFIPLFFALLISVCLFPFARRLENKGFPRGLAALTSMVLFLAIVGSFIYFLVIQIIHFSQDFPQFEQRITLLLSDFQSFITRKYHVNATDQIAYLNRSMSGILNGVAGSITRLFASLLEVFVWTIFVLIYTYFMLYHRRLLHRFVTGLFRSERLSRVNEVISSTRSIINHYIIGLLLEMGIMTIVNCSVFAIMGVKYALFLGMLAAVLNIIPYLGIYTAIFICMLVTFANGTAGGAVSVGVVMIVIHFLDANILMPRIVGSRVKVNALITILAVVIGNQIWGIAGMLLFIPLTAILKIIFEHVDGLAPWALLIGSEEKEVKPRKTKDMAP